MADVNAMTPPPSGAAPPKAMDRADRRRCRRPHGRAQSPTTIRGPPRRRHLPRGRWHAAPAKSAAICGRSSPCVSEIRPTTYTALSMSDRLFTPRFFVMCGFTFTVFLSAFQLLPTAPFRIQELGGSTFASGLFLGLLTYASASSAPLTGAIVDHIGQRRALIVASVVIFLCAAGYARDDALPADARAGASCTASSGRRCCRRRRHISPTCSPTGAAPKASATGASRASRQSRSRRRRLLDHAARRLALDLHLVRRAEPADGRHRVRAAGRRQTPAPADAALRRRRAPPDRMARADPVVDAVHVLVRLRRGSPASARCSPTPSALRRRVST